MTTPEEARAKTLEENKAAAERSKKEGTEKLSKGKPTPTQEENDRAVLGEHLLTHEDDGSGPDPNVPKNVEADRPAGGYQTRQAQPAHRSEPHRGAPQPARDRD